MERSPMVLDKQDQISKNGNLTKSILQIEWNPHQNHKTILDKSEKIDIPYGIMKNSGFPKKYSSVIELWEASPSRLKEIAIELQY